MDKTNHPETLSFTIEKVGRCHWPTGAKRMKPWLTQRTVQLHQLWHIWSGSGTILKNDAPHPVTQGNLFWFKPGEWYTVEQCPSQPLGLTYILFNLEGNCNAGNEAWPDLIEEVSGNLGECIARRAVELFWESHLENVRQGNPDNLGCGIPYFTNENKITRNSPYAPIPIIIWRPQNDTDQHAAIASANRLFNALMHEIIWQQQPKTAMLSGSERLQRDKIAKAMQRIQENPKSAGNIAALAAEVGYSTDHFTRTFKRVIGATPQQFVMNTRINQAKHWLQDSELSIKEIADKLGYCDSHFFARHFKHATGLTPTAFRSSNELSARKHPEAERS